jgi:hypothetical protein
LVLKSQEISLGNTSNNPFINYSKEIDLHTDSFAESAGEIILSDRSVLIIDHFDNLKGKTQNLVANCLGINNTFVIKNNNK